MRLARHKDKIGHVADITIRRATDLLAAPEVEITPVIAEVFTNEFADRFMAKCEHLKAMRQLLHSNIPQEAWDAFHRQYMAATDRAIRAERAELDALKRDDGVTLSPKITAMVIEARDMVTEMLDSHVPNEMRIDVDLDQVVDGLLGTMLKDGSTHEWIERFLFPKGLPTEMADAGIAE
jgi:hypothetical protein